MKNVSICGITRLEIPNWRSFIILKLRSGVQYQNKIYSVSIVLVAQTTLVRATEMV